MKGKTGPRDGENAHFAGLFWRARPLVASDDDPSGRNVSRGIVLLDHAERDGLDGFITITGGKLMTYRLMAEWATDAVCRKLGNTRPCTTADLALPGSQDPAEVTLRKVISLPARCAVLRFIVMAIARLPG